MNNIPAGKTRKWIEVVSRFSNWDESGIRTTLEQDIYAKTDLWRFFVKCFFIGLGGAFTISGIVFFFAFNWHDLHKFVKLGMVEASFLIVFLLVFRTTVNEIWKETITVVMAILVGVCFAVFGQIYQTGANAYDFFFGWSVFITLWVIISSYPSLWILYVCCTNAAIILYSEQVSRSWSMSLTSGLCFASITLVLLYAEYRLLFLKTNRFPVWFMRTIGIAASAFATISIISGIYDYYPFEWYIVLVSTIILSGIAIFSAFKTHDIFYPSILPFCLIIILTSGIMKVMDSVEAFFMIGFFVTGSTTALVLALIKLKKAGMENRDQLTHEIADIQNTDGTPIQADHVSIQEYMNRSSEIYSTIFIKIISFIGAILSCCFFSVFLFFGGLFDAFAGLLIIGMMAIGGSVFVNRNTHAVFIQSLSLAVFFMGYIFITIGMLEHQNSEIALYITLMFISILVIVFSDSPLLLFSSILVLNGSLLLLLWEIHYTMSYLYAAYNVILLVVIYLYEATLLSNKLLNPLMAPARLSVACSFIFSLTVPLEATITSEAYDASVYYFSWFPVCMIGVGLVFALYKITLPLALNPSIKGLLIGITVLFLVPTYYAPGIAAAVFMLLLSYHVQYKPVIIISILSLIYFIIQYYYQLNVTLFVKSMILFGTGVMFLLSYLLLNKQWNNEAKS